MPSLTESNVVRSRSIDGHSIAIDFDSGSYRDRQARVVYVNGEVCRALSATGLSDWEAVSASPFFTNAVSQGRVVATSRIEDPSTLQPFLDAGWSGLLQHERIPFISYPYEWSPSMLRDAGLLELDLLSEALGDGLRLKDGTPFNVAFQGCQPMFIDIGSIERQPESQPWPGYLQFCQTILNPLLLAAYRGLPFPALLRAIPEGIAPAETSAALGFRNFFRKGVFQHVWLHARLAEQAQSDNRRMSEELPRAGFRTEFVYRTVKSLRAALSAIRMPVTQSHWTTYAQHNSYSQQDVDQKQHFVAKAAASQRWKLAWDLGCNTGRYSRIVAPQAETVVAFDADVATIDSLYNALRSEGPRNILPLCVNVANPSPRLGWLLNERLDLPSRGRPDLTLCLALLHHLVLGSNLPLEQVIDWLASLGPYLVIEFVSKADPMVQALLRNRVDQFPDYNEAAFERLLSDRCSILNHEQLAGGTRRLYFAHRKA